MPTQVNPRGILLSACSGPFKDLTRINIDAHFLPLLEAKLNNNNCGISIVYAQLELGGIGKKGLCVFLSVPRGELMRQ